MFQLPIFFLISVLLSPTVTHISAPLRFVMFSSEVTMCGVAPEYAINFLLSYFCLAFFWYIASCGLLILWHCFKIRLGPFSSYYNPFLRYYSFFNHCIYFYFYFFVTWTFFPDSLATVFLDMYRFVTVVTFYYVCAPYVSVLLWLVTVSPTNLAGNLVLVFHAQVFINFSWYFCS